jgi:hypothetical protein
MSVTNKKCQKFLSLALKTFLVKIPGMFTKEETPSKETQKPLTLLLIGKEQKRLRSKRNINK